MTTIDRVEIAVREALNGGETIHGMARAAVAALKDPEDCIVVLGWNAMIDAILEEKP